MKALEAVCADVRPAASGDALVAAPASVEEAAAVLRVAAEHGLAVIARGGGGRLGWGPPPSRRDLFVDTRNLDRVVEHAAGDLVVKVQAGLRMDRLAAVLAESGQRLALDAPLPAATVGGTIATGAAGPLRHLYGTPRDLVIGLTIVRADGEIARSGGKVVKNVAGYDLGRLFSGSFGTLGLIVEAAFRLHPVPAVREYLTAVYADADAAHEAVQAVLHSPAAPSAVECATIPDGIAVGVLLEGATGRAAQVLPLLGQGARVGDAAPEWWGRYPEGAVLIEVTGKPTALPDFLRAAPNLTWSACGHGYVGLAGETTPAQVADLLVALRRIGGAVVRSAPAQIRDAVDVWGPIPALSLMRRVKDQFDPEHRLSPGRFVGGI
ncbi:FAD-binding oxidoreductase [Actinomadura macrotermitis]|uniref:Putative FAD-linked oxidoreductase n=1 Tax=Actinomadura macrotermitis TaxID=2585200 RepID=A0A7K0BNL4_9ACTN|nr:FAD-binding oxidoreductase [Actinomadura macrotermitis]MQY02765.1 putative FAD-linked oxidoreductase [Actinomadura macrotermitis]